MLSVFITLRLRLLVLLVLRMFIALSRRLLVLGVVLSAGHRPSEHSERHRAQ